MTQEQLTCAQCGALAFTGIRYCGRCGAQLPEVATSWSQQQQLSAIGLGIGLVIIVAFAFGMLVLG